MSVAEREVTSPVWLKGTLMLVAALIAGALIGVAYERGRTSAHEAPATHHVMHRLTDELGLDSAQQKAIAIIFARHQRGVDSTWHALQPHVRAAMDSTLGEIVGVLRPDQAVKYRAMVQTRHPGALR